MGLLAMFVLPVVVGNVVLAVATLRRRDLRPLGRLTKIVVSLRSKGR